MSTESWSGTFFEIVSDETRETLTAMAEPRRFHAGELIFISGENCPHMFIIRSGRVAIQSVTPPQSCTTLLDLGPGDLFSWSALVIPYLETATARAVDDTEVLAVDAEAVLARCESDARFGCDIYRALTSVLAERLRATRLQLVDVYAHA